MITFSKPLFLEFFHHIKHPVRHGQFHANGLGCILRIRQILDMKLDTEARIKITVQHHRRLGIHNRTACQPAADSLVDILRIYAGFRGQNQGLRQCGNIYRHNNLIGQLGHIPASHWPYKNDRGAHLLQNRLYPVKHLLLSAAHKGKRGIHRLGFSSAHRCIQHFPAGRRHLFFQLYRNVRINGAHIHKDRSRLHAFQDAVLPFNYSFYMRGVGKHGEDDIAFCRRFPGRIICCGAGRRHIRHCILINIAYIQLIPCLQQIFSHGFSHDSKTNKTYFHLQIPSLLCSLPPPVP